MDLIRLNEIRLDPVQSLYNFYTRIDVLRIDLIHPVISGNKWFKLKHYLAEAIQLKKKYLLTFGGAYSNHIVATAAAAKASGIKSIGIIRGEEPSVLSESLVNAKENGMELYYSERKDYAEKKIPEHVFENYGRDNIYVVNEGGSGIKGMEGAMEILDLVSLSNYDHIVAATGTGTMLAGLINKVNNAAKITGITVLKNNFSVEDDIRFLLPSPSLSFNLIYDYHFGGYAKKTGKLTDFMNDWFTKTGIPSDFVYTGKLFYAVNDLIEKSYFPRGENILIIHSGGLQGNNSLPKGTLIF
jgi:1-aminocyclopropane-1-carboxylate deaminase